MDRDELMIADGDRHVDATYDSLEHIIRHEDLQKFVLFKTHFRKYMEMSDAYEELMQRLDECEQQLELAQVREIKIASDLVTTEVVLRERDNALQRKEDELFAADERIAQLECELELLQRKQPSAGKNQERGGSRRLHDDVRNLPECDTWRADSGGGHGRKECMNEQNGSLCCAQCTEHPILKSKENTSRVIPPPVNALCRCVGCCYCCSSGWLQQECRALKLERGELQLRCQVLKAQMGEELDAARCDNLRLNRALEIAERETEHWKRLWEHLRQKVQRLETEKKENQALQDLLRTGLEHLARCPGAGPSLGLPPSSYSSCKLCARLRFAYARPVTNSNGKIGTEPSTQQYEEQSTPSGKASRHLKEARRSGLCYKKEPEHQHKGILVNPSSRRERTPASLSPEPQQKSKEPSWSATTLLSKMKRKKSPLCKRMKFMRQTKSFDCDEHLKLSEWKGSKQNGAVSDNRTATLPRGKERARSGDDDTTIDGVAEDFVVQRNGNQAYSRRRGTRLTRSFGDWDRDDDPHRDPTPSRLLNNNDKEHLEYDSAAAEKILKSVPFSTATTFTLSRGGNNDDSNPWLAGTWLSTLRRSESKKSGDSGGQYDTSLWLKHDFGGLQCPLVKGEPTDDLDHADGAQLASSSAVSPAILPITTCPTVTNPSNQQQPQDDSAKCEPKKSTSEASGKQNTAKVAKEEKKQPQHSPMSFRRLFDKIRS